MVEGIGDTAVTVSVIGNPVPANPIPESEMDALLLGRTKVSCEQHTLSMSVRVVVLVNREICKNLRPCR